MRGENQITAGGRNYVSALCENPMLSDIAFQFRGLTNMMHT